VHHPDIGAASQHESLRELSLADLHEPLRDRTGETIAATRFPRQGSLSDAAGPVAVRFAASQVEAEWTADKGTLLELAEAAGLHPNFGCRAGICGTCATRLSCGAVDYVEEPVAPRGDGEVLICCATPRSASGSETCGASHGVVLEL
jgi:ferredoxin